MFRDRHHAALLLAEALGGFGGRRADRLAKNDMLVLGLPRGGVPMARAIADALGAPMDVLLVRKLGVPWQRELAFGAIAEGGVRVIDPEVMRACALEPRQVEAVVAHEQKEIERRARLFRGGRSPVEVRGRELVIVDDGLATGSTMMAAVRALRTEEPGRIVVAVPVGSVQACGLLRETADEVVCLSCPQPFQSVGQWYTDFTQVTDSEVTATLVPHKAAR